MRGISWLAANQLADQEGLRTVQSVSFSIRSSLCRPNFPPNTLISKDISILLLTYARNEIRLQCEAVINTSNESFPFKKLQILEDNSFPSSKSHTFYTACGLLFFRTHDPAWLGDGWGVVALRVGQLLVHGWVSIYVMGPCKMMLGVFGKGRADGEEPRSSVAAGCLLTMQTQESVECLPLLLTYIIYPLDILRYIPLLILPNRWVRRNGELSISHRGVEGVNYSGLWRHVDLYLQTVRGILLPINTLHMEAAIFSETSVSIYQYTRASYSGRFRSARTKVSK